MRLTTVDCAKTSLWLHQALSCPTLELDRFVCCLQSFEEAVDQVKNLKETPSDNDLLELYGYYKQATVGDVNTGEWNCYIARLLNSCSSTRHNLITFFTAKPGFLDFKGKAKWESWNGKKGISTDEAKEKYVELVNKLIEQIGLKA